MYVRVVVCQQLLGLYRVRYLYMCLPPLCLSFYPPLLSTSPLPIVYMHLTLCLGVSLSLSQSLTQYDCFIILSISFALFPPLSLSLGRMILSLSLSSSFIHRPESFVVNTSPLLPPSPPPPLTRSSFCFHTFSLPLPTPPLFLPCCTQRSHLARVLH